VDGVLIQAPCGRQEASMDEVNGVTMMPGDKVIMSTTFAGRDPAAWEHHEEGRLDRQPQHVSFPAGSNLCLGLHLARREMNFTIKRFLVKVPQFRLAPGAELKSHLEDDPVAQPAAAMGCLTAPEDAPGLTKERPLPLCSW
jgi:cytochrome P450